MNKKFVYYELSEIRLGGFKKFENGNKFGGAKVWIKNN